MHRLGASLAAFIAAVLGGVSAPSELVNQLFDFVAEQRFAETVDIPFATQQPPQPPNDAVLQRYWRNHEADFTAPEYRTIKLVILSPALLAAFLVVVVATIISTVGTDLVAIYNNVKAQTAAAS